MSSVLGTGVKNKYLFLAVSHSITGEHQGHFNGSQRRVQGSLPVFGWYGVSPGCFSLSQASYDHVGKVKRIPGYLTQSPDFVERATKLSMTGRHLP